MHVRNPFILGLKRSKVKVTMSVSDFKHNIDGGCVRTPRWIFPQHWFLHSCECRILLVCMAVIRSWRWLCLQVKRQQECGQRQNRVRCPAFISWQLPVVAVSIAWTSDVRTLPLSMPSLPPSAPTPSRHHSPHNVSLPTFFARAMLC